MSFLTLIEDQNRPTNSEIRVLSFLLPTDLDPNPDPYLYVGVFYQKVGDETEVRAEVFSSITGITLEAAAFYQAWHGQLLEIDPTGGHLSQNN